MTTTTGPGRGREPHPRRLRAGPGLAPLRDRPRAPAQTRAGAATLLMTGRLSR